MEMRGLPTEGSCSPFEGADNLIGYPASIKVTFLHPFSIDVTTPHA
ncbi:MAG TPA: hypothetical protein VFA10_24365 [Ktedonobacteraceae bacterium]|nr:hypothetical protein [Ktedonobacteraceae bacterium]